MFERGPITIRLISPRSTAPYQTLDSSSRTTSPTTVAPGTTHALEWMVGPFFKRAAIPACPVGSESASICIQELKFNIVRSASNVEFCVIEEAIRSTDDWALWLSGDDELEALQSAGPPIARDYAHPACSMRPCGKVSH